MANSQQKSLNLRGHRFQDLSNLENEIEIVLDRFLNPFLNSKSGNQNRKIEIVVGRGLNSNTFIDGKNPLRFYTEMYLHKTGFDWKNNGLNPGIIEVYC
jgi:hypothetical protein